MCVGGCGSVYLLSLSISENDRQDLSFYLYPLFFCGSACYSKGK